jgi:hypothetical protein
LPRAPCTWNPSWCARDGTSGWPTRLYADDAVLIAALGRALVETEARRWRAGSAVPAHRIEMLRLAAWRASRSSLDDVLLNPRTGLPEPALTVANTLLEHVRDALDEAGDADTVTGLLGAVLARGNGAAFQRRADDQGCVRAGHPGGRPGRSHRDLRQWRGQGGLPGDVPRAVQHRTAAVRGVAGAQELHVPRRARSRRTHRAHAHPSRSPDGRALRRSQRQARGQACPRAMERSRHPAAQRRRRMAARAHPVTFPRPGGHGRGPHVLRPRLLPPGKEAEAAGRSGKATWRTSVRDSPAASRASG